MNDTSHNDRLDKLEGFTSQLSKDFLESHDALSEQIQRIEMMLTNQEAPAPQHDKLFKALAKAQTEIVNAEMDATNPHYGSQYASLDSVLKAIRGPLSKNGIAFFQLPGRKQTNRKG